MPNFFNYWANKFLYDLTIWIIWAAAWGTFLSKLSRRTTFFPLFAIWCCWSERIASTLFATSLWVKVLVVSVYWSTICCIWNCNLMCFMDQNTRGTITTIIQRVEIVIAYISSNITSHFLPRYITDQSADGDIRSSFVSST